MKLYCLETPPSHGQEPWEVAPPRFFRLSQAEADALLEGIRGGPLRLYPIEELSSSSNEYLDLAYFPEPPRE